MARVLNKLFTPVFAADFVFMWWFNSVTCSPDKAIITTQGTLGHIYTQTDHALFCFVSISPAESGSWMENYAGMDMEMEMGSRSANPYVFLPLSQLAY